MTAYYNEHDENAAAWLRELIKEGHIADGIVDTRSIVAVEAADLRDFDQCHFFAGIGVWSYALRLSGWADDRPVWTGSCPCQPFSAAGKREGFADERHLWPAFHRLIAECRPPTVLGEQVASKDGLAWLDTVFADLEGSGYAAGAADMCAAGLGAPHIRQRLWFVGLADAEIVRSGTGLRDSGSTGQRRHLVADGIGACGLGHDDDEGLEGQRGGHPAEGGRLGAVRPAAAAGEPRGLADAEHDDGRTDVEGRRPDRRAADGGSGAAVRMADADGRDASAERQQRGGEQRQQPEDGGAGGVADAQHEGSSRAGRDPQCESSLVEPCDGSREEGATRPGPVNGRWRASDWLYCRDGKWRPVEPGAFPLAHGAPARVGRLRGYGNALNAQTAQAFIEAVM